jgi:hypothetical protein
MPTGAAGAYGRSTSLDAGATWGPADNTSNRKMLIRGIVVPPPSELRITDISIWKMTCFKFSRSPDGASPSKSRRKGRGQRSSTTISHRRRVQ